MKEFMVDSSGSPLYVDLHGNKIVRSPSTHPYSYDAYVLYKSDDFEFNHTGTYHDRMMTSDYELYTKAYKQVWPDSESGSDFGSKSSKDISRFLSQYFNVPVKLTALLQGCNVGTGNPYWIFYYKREEEVK